MNPYRELEDFFAVNSYKIGKTIYYFKECGSTQEEAKKISSVSENGTCVIADIQTQGRGREQRKWISPPGGLWLTIILKQINDPRYINPALSVATVEVINYLYGIEPSIYWPNDIYIQGKKVAGILTEAIHQETSTYFAGIGININIEQEIFQKYSLLEATSLLAITGKKTEIADFLKEFLIKFNFMYELIQNESYNYIDTMYRKGSYLLNKHIKIKEKEREFSGIVADINIREGLFLRLENGFVKNFKFTIEEIENIRNVEYVEVL